ncbi:MAG: SurA N-terminal domain-containing protein [Nitrospirae bacterium]|nr:SurA N-terminal domain-containing protein [Nitrospirota bacterium]
MLKVMHKNKLFSIVVLSGIIFLITVSFIFWGIGPKSNDASGALATVEGERILLTEYWKQYDETYNRIKDVYKSKEELEKLNLKESVLQTLIDRRVLLITAEEAGIDVSKEELKKEIVSIPYFQKNGAFDPSLYERVLSANRMNVQMFEKELKEDLIIKKMKHLIEETAELSDSELKILEAISEGREQLTDTFLSSKKNQAVQAYIEAQKRSMEIKVNRELLP